MKFYSITVSAARIKDNAPPEISFQNVVGLMVGDMDIIEETLAHARRTYPEAEGWTDYQIAWTEIPETMMFGPFQLTWRAVDTRISTDEGEHS